VAGIAGMIMAFCLVMGITTGVNFSLAVASMATQWPTKNETTEAHILSDAEEISRHNHCPSRIFGFQSALKAGNCQYLRCQQGRYWGHLSFTGWQNTRICQRSMQHFSGITLSVNAEYYVFSILPEKFHILNITSQIGFFIVRKNNCWQS
jgi:hypothetical protein